MFTQLKDYKLWYDGEVSIKSTDLDEFIMSHKPTHICVDELTKDVIEYNKLVSLSERFTVKNECKPLDYSWNIPKKYKQLDIRTVVGLLLQQEIMDNQFTDDQIDARLSRVEQELALFSKNNLNDVLRTIYFIINTFEENNIVWGVGRGSSVSSYILYLMKVHDVDSVEYELHIEDFMS